MSVIGKGPEKSSVYKQSTCRKITKSGRKSWQKVSGWQNRKTAVMTPAPLLLLMHRSKNFQRERMTRTANKLSKQKTCEQLIHSRHIISQFRDCRQILRKQSLRVHPHLQNQNKIFLSSSACPCPPLVAMSDIPSFYYALSVPEGVVIPETVTGKKMPALCPV